MLTIYKASAGSGKTFRLAYQYIKNLLSARLEDGRTVLDLPRYTGREPRRRPHSHILAITFTNKATAEMKGRIIGELDAIGRMPAAGKKDSGYAVDLVRELGCTREELAEKARRVQRLILNDYSAFNVSTIDSFFQTILRSFAREIDRQGDFRLELDKDFAVNAAVTMLIDDVNDGPVSKAGVAQWLESIADERIDSGESGDFNPFNRDGSLFADLSRTLSTTFDEKFEAREKELKEFLEKPDAIKTFAAELNRVWGEKRAALVAKADALEAALAAEGLSADSLNKSIREKVAESRNLDDATYRRVSDALARSAKYLQALKAHSADIEKFAGFYVKGVSASAAVDDALFDWYDTLEATIPLKRVYETIARSLKTVGVLAYISDYINRFRRDNNLILIADTNMLLDSIISESETPFIYERVGVEIHHFLIDEFQDTSRQQWNNLKSLLSNSMDTNADSESLIIGDVKQSIYRWRGGDSSLLDHEVQDIDFKGRSVVRGSGPGENTNYRSAHALVRFNNSLFSRLATRYGVAGYGGIEQKTPDKTASLSAYIHLINGANEPGSTTDRMATLLQQAIEADPARFASLGEATSVDAVTAAILLTGRDILAQHDRGYKWKDIAILCRTNTGASRVAMLLGTYFPEIKLISDEALIVGSSPAVKLIVSLLQMIDMAYSGENITDDSPAMAADPAVPVRRKRGSRAVVADRFEYFLAHGSDPDQALLKALDSSVARTEATGDESAADHATLAHDIESILSTGAASLPALVEAIIAAKIPPETRAAELPYIDAFLDTVNDFVQAYIPTIHSFLDYWSQVSRTLAISSPEGVDAVSIMTVHKAKGLERDCVHIPVLDWAFRSSPRGGWYDLDSFHEIDASKRPPIVYVNASKDFISPMSPFRAQTEREMADEAADNLNVLYVAFTRAKRELSAYLLPKARIDCIVEPIIEACGTFGYGPADPDGLYLDLASCLDCDGNIIYGEPTSPVADKKDEKEESVVTPRPVAAAPFRTAFTNLNKRMVTVDDINAPATEPLDYDIGNDHETPDAETEEAARRGTRLHNILSLMKSADDLDDALAAVDGMDPADDDTDYRSIIKEALDLAGDKARLWFGPDTRRVLCEQTIFNARTGKNFRTDRIVWTDEDTIDIVDFKLTTAITPGHCRQVRDYCRMLSDMGLKGVRGFVWNLSAHEIVEV